MQFILVKSLQARGLESGPVSIEALHSKGLSQLQLTGLPDPWLREGRDKIRSLVSRLVGWGPMDRLLIHLLPAEQSKSGAHLEVPIALACLALLHPEPLSLASRRLLEKYHWVGALSLEGALVPTEVSEVLQQSRPALVLGPAQFYSLSDLWAFILEGQDKDLPSLARKSDHPTGLKAATKLPVKGRYWERFWIYVAAHQRLPLLLTGAPGSGKSYLARWAHALLPPLPDSQAFKIQQIWSLASLPLEYATPLLTPSSRTPLSDFIGLKKKGNSKPGIFSLAHGGLLILDEFAEFNRDCREVLRTVLEQKRIVRSGAQGLSYWPADFWLIATTNPCPCGYAAGQGRSLCRCPTQVYTAYQSRISGPLLDRMSLILFLDRDDGEAAFPKGLDPSFLDAESLCAVDSVSSSQQMASDSPQTDETELLSLLSKLEEDEHFCSLSPRKRRLKARLLLSLQKLFPNQNFEDLKVLVQVQNLREQQVFEALRRPELR